MFNELWSFCTALMRQAGARHGSRANAALGIQQGSLTLYVIINYSPMQKQFSCTKRSTRLFKKENQSIPSLTLVSSFLTFQIKSNYDAVRRALDFMLEWFLDPLVRGNYLLSMRRLVGNRLPQLTKEQSKLVKGAFDFIGLNYYTSYYADNLPPSNGLNNSYNTDS
ncbi:hypothetical protein QOZ80_4BG0344870 [Eleusine coracana subsp. coracana]|nr:hypothetical protein QOZ80_4BG0344870 [Eleusine coracana subsp. coracana]